MTARTKTMMAELLAVLSKSGAMAILEQAENGIKAHTEAHLKFDLTRKQYYGRLSLLVKAGLIEKVSGSYRQTKFGILIWHEYLPKLEAAFFGF